MIRVVTWQLLVFFSFYWPSANARDYVIYSIMHELPMGVSGEVLTKNYYVNMGRNQGVSAGNNLAVYRIISRHDPYENKKRYNYRVKIGELKIVHTEDEAAIGVLAKINLSPQQYPAWEFKDFVIGDRIDVSLNER